MKTIAALSCCLLVASIAAAHSAPAQPRTFRFDIPAGDLGAAIAAFQLVTGVRVDPPPQASLDGLTAQRVSGLYSADDALRRLLAGSGLTFRQAAPAVYTLEVIVAPQRVTVAERAPYRPSTSMTATKTVALLRDVPQSITVVTDSMIADQRMQSMADVVRYVPGVGMAQGEGNRDTPIFRGNSSTSDFFVDGVRDDVQYFRDLYNVERIEALKGPSAMLFGRGGTGGIINRATRQATWSPSHELSLQAGSFSNRRATFDFGRGVSDTVAARMTSMYENSDSYRSGVSLERYGVNPTVALALGHGTLLRFGYEYFHDERTADRGVPSWGDRPVPADRSMFFGDSQLSQARVTVNALTSVIDHRFANGVLLRNRTRYADYDKFYQNVYPSSAVSADGMTLALSAYNDATTRRNLFNQTDITVSHSALGAAHTVLVGAELGRQATHNFRNIGYFGATATSVTVPVSAPTISMPVTFRPSAISADNDGVATVAAVYLQDQFEFMQHVQAIVGVRYDRFIVDVHSNRTAADLQSRDGLVSPRAGLVYKPIEAVSMYGNYSLAYLPRAGEQLTSLSLTTQTLDPERFNNYEVGAKWDPRHDFSLTAAIYRLDRTNVVIPDPIDASRSLLVNGQRTTGLELGLTGNLTRAWNVMGAYAHQAGRITRTLSATAREGAALAQVPAHTFSLWNKYDITPKWGAGVGVIYSADMFTSTDNTVVLPAFTRVDGAVFFSPTAHLRVQANVENVFDVKYYAFAHNNNNITPGSPRAVRFALTTRF